MKVERRHFLAALASGAAVRVATPQTMSKKLGIPGPYPGRVIAVEHPGSIVSGQYQREAVREMLRRGIMELTGAPSSTEAWRVFFEPGDVVGRPRSSSPSSRVSTSPASRTKTSSPTTATRASS